MALFDAGRGAHAGRQDLLAEGFGNVVVGARIETPHDVVVGRLGGHENHRNTAQLRVRLQTPADLDAIHSGHHHVEQDHVGPLRQRQLQRLLTVAGLQNLVPVRFEDTCRDNDEIGSVINNQYLAHASTSSDLTA